MAPMKAEFGRVLARLIRENLRLQVALQTTETILDTLEHSDLAPHNWKETRQRMLDMPGTNRGAEELEPLILRLEQAADFHEVSEVLERMPSARVVQ